MLYSLRSGVVCVGIDLAGVLHRETGVAVLTDRRLALLTSGSSDDEIVAFAALAGRDGTVAINAPTTLPGGRCCLDDCRCRHDPGTRSREIERALQRMRIPILPTTLIKALARRGIALASRLRREGFEPIEVYPHGTLKLLGIPASGKRTVIGRRRIHRALQALVPGLDHPDATEHQLDAVVCALTAYLFQCGKTRTVGTPDEGLMTIPDPGVPGRGPSARGRTAPENAAGGFRRFDWPRRELHRVALASLMRHHYRSQISRTQTSLG